MCVYACICAFYILQLSEIQFINIFIVNNFYESFLIFLHNLFGNVKKCRIFAS